MFKSIAKDWMVNQKRETKASIRCLKKGWLYYFLFLILLSTIVFANGLYELYVDSTDPGCSDIIGSPYCTIQAAIDDISPGGRIYVANGGDYTEELTIDKSLELIGDPGDEAAGPGVGAPILDGVGVVGSAITIEGGVSDVVIEGFEITNYKNRPTGWTNASGGIGSAILAWDSDAIDDVTIRDNYMHDLGWNAILVGNEGQSLHDNWLVENNIVENSAFYGIELTNSKNSDVLGNIITGGVDVLGSADDSQDAILIQTQIHVGSGFSNRNIVVDNNIIDGTITRAGIEILAWDSTDSLTAVLEDIEVTNNKISDAEKGIYVFSVGANAEINDLNINNNILDGNSDGIQIRDLIGGSHGSINILENEIINSIGTSSGILIRSGTPVEDILVNFNGIYGNAMLGINNSGTGTLNAENNWWGSPTGPTHSSNPGGTGDVVSDDVDYDPWLGALIKDEITNPSCVLSTDDVVVSANVSSRVCIEDVMVAIKIGNNNWINFTNFIRVDTVYNHTIDSSLLNGSETVLWRFFANDCYDHITKGDLQQFEVLARTSLTVNPVNPDGLLGWYVTEPVFTLANLNATNIMYRWDSSTIFNYTIPFNLTHIPNPPRQSAGILDLHWFSDTICGLEGEQTQIFNVDLTSPAIKNIMPEHNSEISDPRPEISAFIDEVYQGNSGIDISSIKLYLDSTPVPAVAEIVIATDDATITHTPTTDLAEGSHDVALYVEDNAGNSVNHTWNFTINTELVSLSLVSPDPITYDTKRILIIVNISELVKLSMKDNEGRFRRLCRNCDTYEKTKSFRDGQHNVTFKAETDDGRTAEASVSFLVDSKKPRLRTVKPRRGYTNGTFTIKYTEKNLKNVTLFFKEHDTVGYNSLTFTQCVSGRNQECTITTDLSSFEGKSIDYYFRISDMFASDDSRIIKNIKVDTIKPELTIFSPGSTYSKKVRFDILSSEKLKSLGYIQDNRFKRLCSRCDSYNKTKNFRPGNYTLMIKALDNAGNSDSEQVSFEVTK